MTATTSTAIYREEDEGSVSFLLFFGIQTNVIGRKTVWFAIMIYYRGNEISSSPIDDPNLKFWVKFWVPQEY